MKFYRNLICTALLSIVATASVAASSKTHKTGVEQACEERYVGERLYLEAPYTEAVWFFYKTKYTNLPFKVVGVGKNSMTVEAVYDGGIIGKVQTATISCDATKVY